MFESDLLAIANCLRYTKLKLCSRAISPERLAKLTPKRFSITAATLCVLRGRMALTQATSSACCSSDKNACRSPKSKPVSPSTPWVFKLHRSWQTVTWLISKTAVTCRWLKPRSSKLSALARCARQWRVKLSSINFINVHAHQRSGNLALHIN